jgi:hypothetical protein
MALRLTAALTRGLLASEHGTSDENSPVRSGVAPDGALASGTESPASELESAARALKDHMASGKLESGVDVVIRMLARGDDPARVALEIAAFDTLYNEAGCSYPLIVAADALSLRDSWRGVELGLPLAHAVNVAIDLNKHRPPRKVPASRDPGREPAGVLRKLLNACSEHDADGADGLMRGALWRKWSQDTIEPWLLELNATHFFGGGEGLVLAIKATNLLRTAGFEHARRILPGVAYAMAAMRRDDEQADWQWFRQRYGALEPKLEALWARQGQRVLDEQEWPHLVRAVLDGSRDEAWHAVIGVFAAGASIESVIAALSRAAAERMWRFDYGRDLDGSLDGGWFEVTRATRYMHALREAAGRFKRPLLLRMTLFGVHALHASRVLDLPPAQWLVVDAKGRASFSEHNRLVDSVTLAVRERDAVSAQRAALAWLGSGGSLTALRDALLGLTMNDLYARPTFAAHGVQMIVTAFELAESLPEHERAWPVRAVIRMLASPVRESRLASAVLRSRARLAPKLPA